MQKQIRVKMFNFLLIQQRDEQFVWNAAPPPRLTSEALQLVNQSAIQAVINTQRAQTSTVISIWNTIGEAFVRLCSKQATAEV